MLSHVSFISIPVTDPDRARDFYSAYLGMTVTVDAPHGDTRWIMLEIPGARTQLRLETVEEMPERGGPTLPIIAPDVEAIIEGLRTKGIEIVSEPKPAEWDAQVTYTLIRDPEGNVVLLATG